MNELTAEMNELAPQKDVTCKNHPEALATKHCERCGDFICAACPSFSGSAGCPDCIIEVYCESSLFKSRCRIGALTGVSTAVILFLALEALFLVSSGKAPFRWPLAALVIALYIPLSLITVNWIIKRVVSRLEFVGRYIVLQGDQKMSCQSIPSLSMAFIGGVAFGAVATVIDLQPDPVGAAFGLSFVYWIALLISGSVAMNRIELCQLDSPLSANSRVKKREIERFERGPSEKT